MDKRVNVKIKKYITRFNPPIKRNLRRVTMSTEQIRICLLEHALVEEILDDGTIIPLNIENYDKDNNITIEEKIQKAVPDKEPTGNDEKDIESHKLTKRERRELRRKEAIENNSVKEVTAFEALVETKDIETK